MAQGPCQNPNCSSHGQPHPNCRCYGYAEGGMVEHFCASGPREHKADCMYFASGGQVSYGAIPVDQFQSAEQKYGTPSEIAKTTIEGAAEGLAGPLGTKALTYLNNNDLEGMRARKEANPIAHGVGQVGGLLGGGAKVLAKGAGMIATSLPARLAIENALFTAGDEISKYIKEDPHSSVQSAVLHTGLSGLLGGVAGKAASLAEASLGPTLSHFREAMANRVAGGGADVTTQGGKAANDLVEEMLKRAEAKGIGGYLGNKIGQAATAVTGIPGLSKVGAYLGYKHLDKMIPAMGEKFIQNPASTAGFKAAMDLGEAVIKGDTLLNKAAKAVFEEGSTHIPTQLEPKKIDKLAERLAEAQGDPANLLQGTNNISQYMPDHGSAQGAVLGRASQYLNGIKPNTFKSLPLSDNRIPSQTEVASYQRAVQIAEQPLMVLQHLKQGSLTPADMKTVTAIYPDIYKKMQERLTSAMIDHVDAGGKVPYKQSLMLSMFLGMPLESSTLPQNMLANAQASLPAPPSGQGPIKPLNAKGAQSLSKLPQSTATPSQAREAAKLK